MFTPMSGGRNSFVGLSAQSEAEFLHSDSAPT